ncbi:hypothetical protein JCM15519_10160 [Fundidesulfovibrio butyratiphilus]
MSNAGYDSFREALFSGGDQVPEEKDALSLAPGDFVRAMKTNPSLWRKNGLFPGATNTTLHQITGRKFPYSTTARNDPQGTHFLFLTEKIGDGANRFSPCTSREHSQFPYVLGGTALFPTGRTLHKTTYILMELGFPLSNRLDHIQDLLPDLWCMGIVRQTDIHSPREACDDPA